MITVQYLQILIGITHKALILQLFYNQKTIRKKK